MIIIIQNAESEYFFWNEFGVRFNFIAVGYLVYTNTVIGNIMESYPVVPLFTSLGIVSLLITYWIIRKSRAYLEALPSFLDKLKITAFTMVLVAGSLLALPIMERFQHSDNVFSNELQANGNYKFNQAFLTVSSTFIPIIHR
ncbi:hypothetical protein [Dyadobacter tibetensis]|uniref:hypothetical protein n=1 Tax=Dyadobacter tibetensis TaxID=1211851 RepID=UPI0004717668|nr:hypothetical protein [Dyadobacter tibetensis]